ncbi:hypothetical protein ABE430_08825 [Brevibacillus agri]|uniref:hypothetical protein n=1 Tax=Brevibacillus agri TaxID=51101 RepID=UPI003D21FCB5
MAQLPSTATIKDIIAALQTMEAVNQKADLAAVVGSPAVSTDDVATIISKLQNAKNTLASNITAQGLTTASGSESLASLASKVTASSVKKYAEGKAAPVWNGSVWVTTVTGLAFRPTFILFYGYQNGQEAGIYSEGQMRNNDGTIVNGFWDLGAIGNNRTNVFTINSNGFVMNGYMYNSQSYHQPSANMYWLAIG